MKKEYRQINDNITSTADSRKVEGYAVVFSSESEDLGFRETIHPGAIDADTIKRSDVFAKYNHSDDKVLARCKNGQGSLSLEVDDLGLRYSFEAPATVVGDELLENLRRGEITSSSFAFTVSEEPGSERWHKENGVLYRDIYKIDFLYDVSPVFQPAYAETTVYARAKSMVDKSQAIDKKMDLAMEEIDKLM